MCWIDEIEEEFENGLEKEYQKNIKIKKMKNGKKRELGSLKHNKNKRGGNNDRKEKRP